MSSIPAPASASPSLITIGGFQFDPNSGELSGQGRSVRLPPQPAQLLEMLARNPGQLITRESIRQRLWPQGQVVEFEQSVNACIRKLRKALEDDPKAPRYIQTVPRRGYRLIASGSRPAWPARLLAVVIVIGLGIGFWPDQPSTDADTTIGPVVAVLPFEVVDQQAEWEPLATGLAIETLSALSQLGDDQIGLIAFNSSRQGIGPDLRLTGETLGADVLISGSLRTQGERVRITTAIIEASSGRQLWTESVDHIGGDHLDLQLSLSRTIANALIAEWPLAGARMPDRDNRPLAEAYQAYLDGQYLLHKQDPGSVAQAIEQFRQAATLDPEFSQAHAVLANALIGGGAYVEALDHALNAMALDPESAEAHTAMGSIRLYHDWDFDQARYHFQRAIARNSNLALAHSGMAGLLASQGQHQAAIEAARTARRLDPLSLGVNADVCWYFNFANQFENALIECDRALRLEPNNGWSLLGRTEALMRLDRPAEARDTLMQLFGPAGYVPEDSNADPEQAVRSVYRWWRDVRMPASPPASPYLLATLNSLLGEVDPALDALSQAVDDGEGFSVFLAVDPRLSVLRGNPRFAELALRVGVSHQP